MRSTGYAPWWRATSGSRTAPTGPAMTTLRSMIVHLATMIRYAGIAYIVVQVAIWHSFYAESPSRAGGGVGGRGNALPAQTPAIGVFHLGRHRRLPGARARRAGGRAPRGQRQRVQLAGHRHVGPAHRPRVVRVRPVRRAARAGFAA